MAFIFKEMPPNIDLVQKNACD